MDIESISSETEEELDISEENNEEDIENVQEWLINYKDEKLFWENADKNNLTYAPRQCPACNIGDFVKKETFPINILNPLYLRCANNNCRKQCTLRNYSIFKLSRKMPASVMYKIIELFILKRNNAKEILTEIKENFNKKITYNYICRQLQTIRKILAE